MFNFFKPKVKLVTHLGAFHADDVFACATLSLLLEKKGQEFKVLRTRDLEIIKQGDMVFDVGGVYDPDSDRFDHHQKGYEEKRQNRIPYSSFGLVWKKYGEEVCGSLEIAKHIDQILVEQVDAIDSGMSLFSPLTMHTSNYDVSSVIASFLPMWGEKDEDSLFLEAVGFAKNLLQKEIERYSVILKKKEEFKEAYEKSKDKRIVILEEPTPRYLFNYVADEYPLLLYAVFPSDNKWKIFAFRKKAGSFETRKNLPESWGGLMNEELQEITGVSDAEFCHKDLFLAVAGSRNGIMALANKALEN